jgi:branched-chain amino acid transport system permease protein
MTTSTLIAGAINGLLLGGLYVIIALGLSMVFGVMRLVNVTHGDLLVLSAYLNFVITDALGINPFAATLIVMPILFIVGYGIQRLVLNPVMSKGMEPALLMAFGISIIAQNGMIIAWGGDSRSLSTDFSTSGVVFLGVHIPVMYVLAFVLSFIEVGAVYIFINRTYMGKSIRAATQDPQTAGVLGVNINHVYAITYGIGAATAALGGLLIGLTFSFAPAAGFNWLLKCFVVVVLGGMGSIPGTLAGGLLLGLTEGIGAAILGTGFRDMIGYLIFLLVLLIRPRGLFGQVGTE